VINGAKTRKGDNNRKHRQEGRHEDGRDGEGEGKWEFFGGKKGHLYVVSYFEFRVTCGEIQKGL
jgi:hypothetical protein